VGFAGVLYQPNTARRNIKRCSRLVILPDYQGIGLGTKFLQVIAKEYAEQGADFEIITSAKNMIAALRRSPEWVMVRHSIVPPVTPNGHCKDIEKSTRTKCKTATFFYKNHR
jgi:GNAT superfamily N-acetyltransferase